jgi:hypothetical protein
VVEVTVQARVRAHHAATLEQDRRLSEVFNRLAFIVVRTVIDQHVRDGAVEETLGVGRLPVVRVERPPMTI